MTDDTATTDGTSAVDESTDGELAACETPADYLRLARERLARQGRIVTSNAGATGRVLGPWRCKQCMVPNLADSPRCTNCRSTEKDYAL
jgi:hypothetical protein